MRQHRLRQRRNRPRRGSLRRCRPSASCPARATAAVFQARHEIQDLITATENGLNGIKRTLSSDEQLTATQIRTFLTKAKQALDQDDLDGANTLANKAKVLLGELTKA